MSFSAHRKILSDFGNKPSVIRQRGESQNGGYKKTKLAKFSEKLICLTPWYVSGRLTTKEKITSIFRKKSWKYESEHNIKFNATKDYDVTNLFKLKYISTK